MRNYTDQYKNIDEYLDAEYGKTKFKKGRWRILAPDAIKSDTHELWHQCDKASWDMEMVGYCVYSEYAERPVIPKWRCEICFKSPPDSIVAVWALLEPDATSTEIQEVLKIEEDRKKLEADPMRFDELYGEMLPGWADDDALDALSKR